MALTVSDFQRAVEGLWRMRRHFGISTWQVASILGTAFSAAALEGAGMGLLLPMLELIRTDVPSQPMRISRILMEWVPGRSPAFYTVVLCCLVLCAIAGKNFFLYWGSRITAAVRASSLLGLRAAIYERLQYGDLAVFEANTSGKMASILMLETGRTAYAIEYIVMLLQRGAMLFCYLVALFVVSWQLSLFTALLSTVCGYLLGRTYRSLARSGRELSDASDRVGEQLVETLNGIRVIRSTNSQQTEIENFRELNRECSRIQQESMAATAVLNPITETVGVAGGMVLIGSASLWLVQPGLMRPEMLMGFAFLLVRMLPVLTQTYGLLGQMVNLTGGIEQAEKWLAIPQFPRRSFGKKHFNGIEKSIFVKNLHYSYPNGTPALRGVNIEIEAGKVTALVGGSGSGKTTLASILLRLREPSAGCILVDGEDYWDYSPESWHGSLGVVEQEAFLFHTSLLENVRYGFPQATESDVWKAIRMAHLERVVQSLPDGLHTIVGERGATLSGGQRQRMSIARALTRNPKLLILDEATSALDSVSEAQVQAAIEEAQAGRTVVVIAHRFSTIRRADKIVVMEEGRVMEQGSWAELERRNGHFARLLRAAQETLV